MTEAAPAVSASQTMNAPSAPAPTNTASASAPAVTDWTSGLNEDLKGYVSVKGFKDPASTIESYRNLEKLIGAPRERLLKLPENMEDLASLNEVYARLGRPEKADDYKIEVPKEGGNPEFAKWASSAFHELGLSTKQAHTLAAKWNEFAETTQKGLTEKQASENLEAESGLKKKWGAAFDQNVKVARGAMREFNIAPEVIDKMESAMGFAGVMDFLHAVGSKIGEPGFHIGQSSEGGAMIPEAARNKISALRNDADFVKRYAAGDASAKAEMDRLHKMAYQD